MQPGHLLARALSKRSVDPARQDGVDLDVVGRPGAGAGARELHDAALAGGIGRRVAARKDRHHRADVDDLAVAGSFQRGIGGLRAQEGAGQVSIHDGLPLVQLEQMGRLADAGAGIVDEDVDAAEVFADPLDHRGYRRLVGHVGCTAIALTPRLPRSATASADLAALRLTTAMLAPASASPLAMPR